MRIPNIDLHVIYLVEKPLYLLNCGRQQPQLIVHSLLHTLLGTACGSANSIQCQEGLKAPLCCVLPPMAAKEFHTCRGYTSDCLCCSMLENRLKLLSRSSSNVKRAVLTNPQGIFVRFLTCSPKLCPFVTDLWWFSQTEDFCAYDSIFSVFLGEQELNVQRGPK